MVDNMNSVQLWVNDNPITPDLCPPNDVRGSACRGPLNVHCMISPLS